MESPFPDNVQDLHSCLYFHTWRLPTASPVLLPASIVFGLGQLLIVPFCSDLHISPGHSTPWSAYRSVGSSRTEALDPPYFSPPESSSDCQGSPQSCCNFGRAHELLDTIEDMSTEMYPGAADVYKRPMSLAVSCPDSNDDLDLSQWIQDTAALNHHETYQQDPILDRHGPYSTPSGPSSYHGHGNWSLSGDTESQAINDKDCGIPSPDPAMEFSGLPVPARYAETNDVSSMMSSLIPSTRSYYQGNMSHSTDMQPVLSRTAGFVSNDMDSGYKTGYQDHYRQDFQRLNQDHAQEDLQDGVPGLYSQVANSRGDSHGDPVRAIQTQAALRTTCHVSRPSRADDMALAKTDTDSGDSRETGPSRAHRSNTGTRRITIPSERTGPSATHRPSSKKGSSYKDIQMMPPPAPPEEGKRRDSVQTSYPSVHNDESGQRTDPLYKAHPHPTDKLYHCPFRARGECKHEPTTLKCNYEYVQQLHSTISGYRRTCRGHLRPLLTTT